MWFWYWIVKYSGVLLFTLNSYFDLVALIPINGLNHCCWIVKYCKWCSGFYIEFLFRFVPLLLEDNLASRCLDLYNYFIYYYFFFLIYLFYYYYYYSFLSTLYSYFVLFCYYSRITLLLVALISINGLNHCCWIVKYCKWCSGFYKM